MNGITWIHVAGGTIALLAGAVALGARKGCRLHTSTGTLFCASMFALGVTASILSPLKSPPESPVGGILVCYFVATAWMAARRRSDTAGRFEKVACAIALAIAAVVIGEAVVLAVAPPGASVGPPGPVGLLVLGAVCLIAGLGDLRFIVRKKLSATQRTARHLWRMCLAFFIATGSFFLGQQDVLPEGMRGSPILLLLAFAPLVVMLFWLVRIHIPPSRSLKPQPFLPEN